MIKPLNVTNTAMMAQPVSFAQQSAYSNALNNQQNQMQSDFLTMGSRELSPQVQSSTLGQKLDFYA